MIPALLLLLIQVVAQRLAAHTLVLLALPELKVSSG